MACGLLFIPNRLQSRNDQRAFAQKIMKAPGAGDNLDVKCALEYGKDGIFYFGNSFFIACHSSSRNLEPQS